ncbi:MAG: hypothetical protein R3A10_04405 [Caldilineaceae bacterium]
MGARPADQPEQGQWRTFGYNYEQTRHVPLTQITKDNVSQLGRALVGRLPEDR